MFASILEEKYGINVDREDIKFNVLGVNHFTWVDEARYKGEDLFPLLAEAIEKHPQGLNNADSNWANKSWRNNYLVLADLFKRYGIVAAAGDRHLAEFCPGSWYLNDEKVRIAMPDELQTMLELANTDAGKTFLSAVGADAFVGKTLDTLINRAAEQAAPEAAGIFADAITSMTVQDGEAILFGADNAATQYLHDKTYSGLQTSFGKVVTGTFDQVSVSGHTLNEAWSGFTTYYNKVADFKSTTGGTIAMAALKIGLSKAGKSDLYDKINGIQHVNTNLGEYVTGRALDGLFTKVADKELEIRTDVAARTSSLLQKVFGRLDD